MFDISLLFKIGAMGVLLMVIEKVLEGNGKKEFAVLANLAGMVIILITIIGMISNLFDTVRTMFTFEVNFMEIIKIALFAFTALFIFLLLKDKKSEIGLLVILAAGIGIFLYMIGQLGDVIEFIKDIANKANIDTVYIGIVLKILAIAYITSFCSEICKDSGAGSIGSKVEFAGKIMILGLAIPILMAVLNSILQIL